MRRDRNINSCWSTDPARDKPWDLKKAEYAEMTTHMNNPFGENLASEPFETVFANLNPVIQGALDGFRELAEMFGAGPRATAQAVATNLEHNQGVGEVAVTSLLAGIDAIFKSYRASFLPVGASLNTQIDAIEAAWVMYGHTGRWLQPVSRKVSGSDAPGVLIRTCDPRSMSYGECITAEATESAIGKAITISTNLASTSHHVFGGLVANVLPVGELMDAIDVAAVDHARAFADLHKTLAASVHEFTNTIETSLAAYRQTGQWDSPTVTIGA